MYLVSLDAGQRHVDHVAAGVGRERLDHRRLARAGRSVQKQPQLVGIPLDSVLAWGETDRRSNFQPTDPEHCVAGRSMTEMRRGRKG